MASPQQRQQVEDHEEKIAYLDVMRPWKWREKIAEHEKEIERLKAE